MSEDDILGNAAECSEPAGGMAGDATEEIADKAGMNDAAAYADNAPADFKPYATYEPNARSEQSRPIARRVPYRPRGAALQHDEGELHGEVEPLEGRGQGDAAEPGPRGVKRSYYADAPLNLHDADDDVIDSPFFEQQFNRLQNETAADSADAGSVGADASAPSFYDEGSLETDSGAVAEPGVENAVAVDEAASIADDEGTSEAGFQAMVEPDAESTAAVDDAAQFAVGEGMPETGSQALEVLDAGSGTVGLTAETAEIAAFGASEGAEFGTVAAADYEATVDSEKAIPIADGKGMPEAAPQAMVELDAERRAAASTVVPIADGKGMPEVAPEALGTLDAGSEASVPTAESAEIAAFDASEVAEFGTVAAIDHEATIDSERAALFREVAEILGTGNEENVSDAGETFASDSAPSDEGAGDAADGSDTSDESGGEGEDSEKPADGEGQDGVEEPANAEKQPKRFSLGLFIGCVAAALVVGLLVGTFVIGIGPAGSSVTGKIAISESELDNPVAAYSTNGKSGKVTAREVIEQTSSLAQVVNEDGAYAVPSADSVLSVARNKIVVADAQSRGITATDEEVAAYAEAQLGTSDFATIAKNYAMEEDSVIALLRESCLMSKLRDEVLGEQGAAAEMPASPTEPGATTEVDPETGEEHAVDPSKVATKEYADYIIALAGDEWDAEKGTWASQDGPYAKALAGYEVTPDSATYEAATMAYYVAYQAYSEASSAVTALWSDYVNDLLSKSSITIYNMLT